MQTAAQAISKGLAFSVYGENIIILFQNAAILLLIWQYNKSIGSLEKLGVVVFFGAYAFVLYSGQVMTEDLWLLVSNSSSLMQMASKLPQLYTNFTNKSTGQMAFFTFFLNFAGAVARLGTVMFESDDIYFQI